MATYEQPISENDSDLLPNQPEVPIVMNNHYRDAESEQSDKPPSHIDELTSETKPFELKVEKVQHEFKLQLPEPEKPQQEAARAPTRHGRHGRILIEQQQSPAFQAQERQNQIKRTQAVKIYDLEEDEKQESILGVSFDQDPNREPEDQIPIKVSVSIKIPEPTDPEPQDQATPKASLQKNNNFVSESPANQKDEHTLKIQPSRKQVLDNRQNANSIVVVNSKSKIIGGVKGSLFEVTKNFFASEDKQDYLYYNMPNVDSRNSLDTGLQLTTSRDQLSSRHILQPVSPEKSRKRLPTLQPLKPLNETLKRREQKLYELQQYKKLEVLEAELKQLRRLSNGKYSILREDITDVFSFLCKGIPFDKCVETTITRNKSCSKMGYLDYDMSTNDDKYLLSCKKMPFHLGSTYNLSLQKNAFGDDSDFLVGKVKGNFVGSTFNIYSVQETNIGVHELDATVYYTPDCSCCKVSTREVSIYLKNRYFRYEELTGAQSGDNKNLKELYEIESNRTLRKIVKYVSKKAKWNPELQAYTVNLRRKAKYASVKNMVIVSAEDESEEGLLLAKKGQNQFQFDISYPFSPIIALGVAMTSFDFKLASQ